MTRIEYGYEQTKGTGQRILVECEDTPYSMYKMDVEVKQGGGKGKDDSLSSFLLENINEKKSGEDIFRIKLEKKKEEEKNLQKNKKLKKTGGKEERKKKRI